jgi:hypothetical protein
MHLNNHYDERNGSIRMHHRVWGALTGLLLFGMISTNAGASILLGSANYVADSGNTLSFESTETSLIIDIDGFNVLVLAGADALEGMIVNLSTQDPGAFAALAAAFLNGVNNDIGVSGLGLNEIIADFSYAFPASSDFQGFSVEEISVGIDKFQNVNSGIFLIVNGMEIPLFSQEFDVTVSVFGPDPSSVPEPTTLLLLGLGFAGLSFARQRGMTV